MAIMLVSAAENQAPRINKKTKMPNSAPNEISSKGILLNFCGGNGV
jgi:hypothetical protein